MANMDACKTYAQISGWILLVIGILGFVTSNLFVTQVNATHNVLHLILAVISLWLGYKGSEAALVGWAKTIGVVYLLLGIIGFFGTPLNGLFNLDTGANVIHLVLGAWGAWAGFVSK